MVAIPPTSDKIEKKTLIRRKVVFLKLGLCEFRVSSKLVHDPICFHLHCLIYASELIKRAYECHFVLISSNGFSHTLLFQWMELRNVPWIFIFFPLLSFQGVTIDTPWDKLGGTPSFHNWVLWMSYLLQTRKCLFYKNFNLFIGCCTFRVWWKKM
jgi:hypothetical protein